MFFQELEQIAIRIAHEVERLEICPENMPPSLAAGVIALVLQQPGVLEHPDTVPYERIASVCGVSEGTLQKCMKKLELAVQSGQIKLDAITDTDD